MTAPFVRDATADDLAAILEIHNDAIAHTTAIWDEEQVELPEREAWFAQRAAGGFPVLVADVDSAVGGYASYGPWRPKSGYRHTVENSLYVHPDFRRRGLAALLLPALLERARAADVHVVVAAIEAGNDVSIALHERHGFERVGLMPQVGTKFDRWLDLALLQLTLEE